MTDGKSICPVCHKTYLFRYWTGIDSEGNQTCKHDNESPAYSFVSIREQAIFTEHKPHLDQPYLPNGKRNDKFIKKYGAGGYED